LSINNVIEILWVQFHLDFVNVRIISGGRITGGLGSMGYML